MKIKIIDGTPHGSPHLCRSCCSSLIRTESDREVIFCQALPPSKSQIQGRVTSCSSYCSYDQQQAMSRFRGQAWLLDLDETGSAAWSSPADRNPVVQRRRRRRNSNPSVAPPPTEPTVQ